MSAESDMQEHRRDIMDTTTSIETIAQTIVGQMSIDDRRDFDADKWRDGVGSMLVDEWEDADLDEVMEAVEKRAAWPQPGDSVCAGEGEDYDEGIAGEVTGDMVEVHWTSGVSTPCPLSDLHPVPRWS